MQMFCIVNKIAHYFDLYWEIKTDMLQATKQNIIAVAVDVMQN